MKNCYHFYTERNWDNKKKLLNNVMSSYHFKKFLGYSLLSKIYYQRVIEY